MAKFISNKQKAENLLPDIIKATTEGGFLYVEKKLADLLVEAGQAEINETLINDAGEVATRATEEGSKAVMSEPVEETKAGVVDGFPIETGIPVPETKRANSGRTSKYPFDALDVDQSFFVADGDAKALGSTVSSANGRYAVPVEDASGNTVMKTYKVKGEFKTKPEMRKTRVFKVAPVDGGARIWRVK
jgi:hypothetical protein